MGRACNTHEKKDECIQRFGGKCRRPIGKLRRRWEDTIKTVLREIGWGVMNWIHLAQDRDQWRAPVNKLINLWIP
jgi:hypothetical protein